MTLGPCYNCGSPKADGVAQLCQKCSKEFSAFVQEESDIGIVSLRVGGREYADLAISLERSNMPGHRDTFWSGNILGLGYLVVEVARRRQENLELRAIVARLEEEAEKLTEQINYNGVG